MERGIIRKSCTVAAGLTERKVRAMNFDWSEKSKEKYFRKARKIIREAGYKDILKVDKKQFGIAPGKVKVYFKVIDRREKTKRWEQEKKEIFGLKECSLRLNGLTGRAKTVYIHPYIELEMSRKDA